jgi:hypothetical protein
VRLSGFPDWRISYPPPLGGNSNARTASGELKLPPELT